MSYLCRPWDYESDDNDEPQRHASDCECDDCMEAVLMEEEERERVTEEVNLATDEMYAIEAAHAACDSEPPLEWPSKEERDAWEAEQLRRDLPEVDAIRDGKAASRA